MAKIDPWTQQVVDAGTALGLQPMDFAKQVAVPWQLAPLVAGLKHLSSPTHGCLGGTWRERRASATVLQPRGVYQPRVFTFKQSFFPDRYVQHWSEGTLLVTSVGFTHGVVPFVLAAPTTPFRVNDRQTYDADYWIPPVYAAPFSHVPVPGDTNGDWVPRSPRTDQTPAAMVAAIAPMLLDEPAYPWKTDGGKNGSHAVDLVRIDVGPEGAPPPTADVLRSRLDRLAEMATAIERALA